MSPKGKAAAPAAKKEEPAAKKAKTEEPKKEEPKKDEEIKDEGKKFEEPDAPKDSRQVVKDVASFTTDQSTLNVVPTTGGKMLTTITEGGMSFLLAGARANIGLKAGRYMFEVKIIQMLSSSQDKKSLPVLKVGFSTTGSSLFLGEDELGVCFGSLGEYIAEKGSTSLPAKARFSKDKVIAVVLNLDSKSPNANTVSLYLEGERIAEPKALPECLKGKTLFPHVTYKNMTIRANFGPTPLKDLPFKCRMVNGAANSDVSVISSKEPKQYEVILPVAFPDEGTFAWVDSFLEDNPHYVELSDRKIAEWCKSSGLLGKPSGNFSNDKPLCSYGCPGLDDFSVRKVLHALAPCLPRNYLIMEVKSNLLADERKEILKKFNYPCFKKVARVIMGKPNKTFKDIVQSKILKTKQDKSDAAWKAKKEADARKKLIEKRKQEVEKKKKAEIAKKKGEAVEEEDETKESEEDAEDPPSVELTDEEKAMTFFPSSHPDLTPAVFTASYAKFSTPGEDEGFDDIHYEWEDAKKSIAYLQSWVQNKKLTTRVDDLKPGQYFRDKAADFDKLLSDWQRKQKMAKKPAKDPEDEPDIYAAPDINNIDGVPLYDKFSFEDWELTKLRFQFAVMLISFKKDCDDPDRVGIPLDHVSFYYNRYFNKSLNPKSYGVSSESQLFALVKDVVSTKDNLLVSEFSDDLEALDTFVKVTEEKRRERQRRIDAGDETAKLKFTTFSAVQNEAKAKAGKGKGK